MSFYSDLVTYLNAQMPALEGRIYPVQFPSRMILPALKYQSISSSPDYSRDGMGLNSLRVQFDIRAITAKQAASLKASLVQALSGYHGLMGATRIGGAFVETENQDAQLEPEEYLEQTDIVFQLEP